MTVLDVTDTGDRLRVTIETRGVRPSCRGCVAPVVVKDRDMVELTDLPCLGQPAVLVWRKIRWECPSGCGSFTEQAPAIAAPRLKLTDRAGRWATIQVGRHGRSVSEVAKDLGCSWHAVMDAVAAYGQVLVDDPGRFGDVAALGLDETLRCRLGRWRRQQWTTQIVDVGAGQLLDVVEGRSAQVRGATPVQAVRHGAASPVVDVHDVWSDVHPTAGMIFHKSSTSLHLWFYAMYLMTSTRCGISASSWSVSLASPIRRRGA